MKWNYIDEYLGVYVYIYIYIYGHIPYTLFSQDAVSRIGDVEIGEMFFRGVALSDGTSLLFTIEKVLRFSFPLGNVYITMEISTIFYGKTHCKLQFLMAMLNYQEVFLG